MLKCFYGQWGIQRRLSVLCRIFATSYDSSESQVGALATLTCQHQLKSLYINGLQHTAGPPAELHARNEVRCDVN